MSFYVYIIPSSRILGIQRYGSEGPGAEGSVMRASFSLGGLTVMCIDSPISHGFTFTPASSLFVTCSSEAEIERIAAALGEGGQALMPLDDYGFSRKFTWVNDQFGVSWQLNLD